MRTSELGLSIRRTPYGKGVFAKKAFRKNQAIGEVGGRVRDVDDDYDDSYVMDFSEGVLEPSAPFRYLNHCCEPNAELVEVEPADAADPSSMWVYALRTIRPGDQITIDYAWPAHAAIQCGCGVSSCRGWIVDPGEINQLTAKQRRIAAKAKAEREAQLATSKPKAKTKTKTRAKSETKAKSKAKANTKRA